MASLGLTNAFGLQAGTDALVDLMARQQLARQAVVDQARKDQQQQFENDIKSRTVAVDEGKLSDARRAATDKAADDLKAQARSSAILRGEDPDVEQAIKNAGYDAPTATTFRARLAGFNVPEAPRPAAPKEPTKTTGVTLPGRSGPQTIFTDPNDPTKVLTQYDEFQRPAAGADPEAAAGKNYNISKKQLDDARKPYAAQVGNIDELNNLLDDGSPQSDALVAPKLLTSIVGGQGTGLRINQSEIERVVGGRSVWQTLEAKLNQVKLDPSQANSITPAQRQQIRAIVKLAGDKANEKLKMIEDADDALLNASSPGEQRKIVVDLQKALEGPRNGPTANPVAAPGNAAGLNLSGLVKKGGGK